MGIIDEQARDLLIITPSDTVALAPAIIALYIGGAGNIVIVTEAKWNAAKALINAANPTASQIITQAIASALYVPMAVPAGFILNCRIMAVLNSGNTATGMVGYLP